MAAAPSWNQGLRTRVNTSRCMTTNPRPDWRTGNTRGGGLASQSSSPGSFTLDTILLLMNTGQGAVANAAFSASSRSAVPSGAITSSSIVSR